MLRTGNEKIILQNDSFKICFQFAEALYPANVDIRADTWYFLYRVQINSRLINKLYFFDRYEFLNNGQLLVLEALGRKNQLFSSVTNQDLGIGHIVLIDLVSQKVCRFSEVHNGNFNNFRLNQDLLEYEKHFNGICQTFDIPFENLRWNDLSDYLVNK